MKKALLLLFLTYSTLTLSQSSKKSATILTNDGQKIECILKSLSWKSSPKKIKYKLDTDSEKSSISINNVKEITFRNGDHYVAVTVKLDNSSNLVKNLTTHKDFEFIERRILLKTLVSGKANLYQSNHEGVDKYFYSTEKTKTIVQLLHKRYLIREWDNDISNYRIVENNFFIRQISKYVSCTDANKLRKLIPYHKRSLVKQFKSFNNLCQ